mgnify:CR=1 FL=1
MRINGRYEGSFLGNLSGTATRAQNAAINTVTNTLTYFDNNSGHFNYTAYVKYLKHLSAATESGDIAVQGYSDGLIISSNGTFYSSTDVIAK